MIVALFTATIAVQLVHVDDPGHRHFGSVVVEGVDTSIAGIEGMLAVYTAEGPADRPAILGRVTREPDRLRFKPRFMFVTSLDYRAEFDAPAYCRLAGCRARATLSLVFRMPEPPAAAATRVLTVSPQMAVVPENLLRFYVHFSGPMRTVDAHRYIRLVDDTGALVSEPFVVVRQGLWGPNRQRLTLVIHPGRIKRGVGPNMALGPVLRSGRRFRLIVDKAMPDASGRPLGESFVHEFLVSAPARSRLDPSRWTVVAPQTASEPVVLVLADSVDSALLQRLPYVERESGERVQGRVAVSVDAKTWSLTPQGGWRAGRYRLIVPRSLEDLAGNTVDHRFEESSGRSLRSKPQPVVRVFEVR